MNVRIVDDVYLDMGSAKGWYSDKRDGLGDEFSGLFFRLVEDLPRSVLHHAIDETGYRPIRMPRFNAVIYYSLADTEILIVGILVNGRSPAALKNRG